MCTEISQWASSLQLVVSSPCFLLNFPLFCSTGELYTQIESLVSLGLVGQTGRHKSLTTTRIWQWVSWQLTRRKNLFLFPSSTYHNPLAQVRVKWNCYSEIIRSWFCYCEGRVGRGGGFRPTPRFCSWGKWSVTRGTRAACYQAPHPNHNPPPAPQPPYPRHHLLRGELLQIKQIISTLSLLYSLFQRGLCHSKPLLNDST